MEPTDGLAFIGRNPGDDNVFIATGDSGNGITHGDDRRLADLGPDRGPSNPWANCTIPRA